jgi:oxygen-independent coproporphyrinogen III oxidase
MAPRSLYIHVPFCTRRCSYCDFAVEATSDAPAEEWLASIVRELELTAEQQEWSLPLEVDTVYIGGGTPSLLGTGVMHALRDRVARMVRWSDAAEWTCEANPESFSPQLARDWKQSGVNRISLGLQTFHEPALRWMGRLHGPDGPPRAVQAAREAGFDNVSLDLIFGLPLRLQRDWEDDLNRVIALQPEHVSLYGLTAEAGAPLGRWVGEGRETLADEDSYAAEYLLAHERLTAAGFEHYEVSNFGRPGRFSRHNSAYWTGEPYAALGPGAHAFFPPERRWNLRSWSAYREALKQGVLPLDGTERIDSETAELERAWLVLRTNRSFRPDAQNSREAQLMKFWLDNEFADVVAGGYRLSPRGWLLLDELAVALHSARSTRAAERRRPHIDGAAGTVQILANSNEVGG